MGIFKRISMIIRSNINALIDKAEEPEKMLEQIIADMIENMREIKLQVARSMRDEKMLERKVEENEKLAQEYTTKAELALEKGDDTLAREALKRRKSYQSIGESLKKELEEQHKVVEMLQTSFKALEVKIEEAKNKRQILLSRQKRAETQVDLSTTLDGVSEQADLLESFERMADKVSRSEAMASALVDMEKGSVEEKFSKLEEEKSVEDELKLLKDRMKSKK
ncbi:MAG TPA: PspA/IM30 family protein [Candidatus Ozemobacteraceae bacterium]|nr:PspA/IM30 family protein [Candidatus Ozemobacteraceae bacterium]